MESITWDGVLGVFGTLLGGFVGAALVVFYQYREGKIKKASNEKRAVIGLLSELQFNKRAACHVYSKGRRFEKIIKKIQQDSSSRENYDHLNKETSVFIPLMSSQVEDFLEIDLSVKNVELRKRLNSYMVVLEHLKARIFDFQSNIESLKNDPSEANLLIASEKITQLLIRIRKGLCEDLDRRITVNTLQNHTGRLEEELLKLQPGLDLKSLLREWSWKSHNPSEFQS